MRVENIIVSTDYQIYNIQMNYLYCESVKTTNNYSQLEVTEIRDLPGSEVKC